MKTTEGIKRINNIDIYYKTIGEGEPVVVVHGGPGLGHNYLLSHFERLADNYQLIFYDQRSCGLSSGHENPLDITVEAFVEDLEFIRNAFEIEFLNLAGHSWGGLLAMLYAIKYHGNLKTLMLLESAGASSEYISMFNNNIKKRLSGQAKQELSEIASSFNQKEYISKQFRKYQYLNFSAYFYNKELLNKLDLDYLDDEMVKKSLIGSEYLTGDLSDYDIFDELSKISCPVLILHGDFDPIPFQFSERIHRAIENSKFILLEKSGHFSFIEKPEIYFGAIEEFLQKNVVVI